MNLVKLILLLGALSIVGFVGSRLFWDGKQKEAENRVMTAYINKNKEQILNLKSSGNLACNKTECLANFNSLQESKVLTNEDETFFKDRQYYVFNKKEDGEVDYRIMKSKQEIKKSQDTAMLLSMLAIM